MARVRGVTAVAAMVLCGILVSASPALAGTGSIQGTVTDDDPSHNALQGIRACFYEPKGATEEACTQTDGSGHYVLGGLNPGEYIVSFRAAAGQNLVTQYYNGKTTFVDANPVAVGSGPVSNINAEMHEGGTITGAATDAGSSAPIAGLSVCADANGGLYSGCTVTDASGDYSITGLPADPEYHVEFTAGENLNYLSQSYDGKEGLDNWDPVPVVVGGTEAGIDAVMNPGAQIAGNVTEAGAGTPVGGIEVCALDPAGTPRAEEFERCAFSDAAGNYTIRSLRAGTFVVVFSRARFVDADGYAPQFYDGVDSESQATRIAISPPDTRTGVDASLINWWPHPKPPEPIIVTLIEQTPKKPPLRCKRHFHKKRIKGKVRCVRIHKKHITADTGPRTATAGP
jgi:hypothetical protein